MGPRLLIIGLIICALLLWHLAEVRRPLAKKLKTYVATLQHSGESNTEEF